MATPVFVDDGNRAANTDDIVISSFSADADDVLFAHVSTSSSTISSTPTGHGTWSQIGSSETAPNSSGLHLFACVVTSTGSAAVTVARATSGVMAVQMYKVPGLDVTSGVSSSYSQVKQANFTSSTFTVTFETPVTETTMGFYGGLNTQVLTAENTELDQGWYQYELRGMAAYNAAGDDTPSATCSFSYGSMIAIELVEASSGSTLVAGSGSYAYTGTAAGLLRGYSLTAESGSYAYSGTSADLVYTPIGNFTLVAGSGSYAYTGTAADLLIGRNLVAGSGAYTYAGITVDLQRGLVMVGASGAYVYSGTVATLTRNIPLFADSGAYVYSGTIVSIIENRILTSDSGSYSYIGTSADLDFSGGLSDAKGVIVGGIFGTGVSTSGAFGNGATIKSSFGTGVTVKGDL